MKEATVKSLEVLLCAIWTEKRKRRRRRRVKTKEKTERRMKITSFSHSKCLRLAREIAPRTCLCPITTGD
jgi:hypothetical protein